MGKATARVNPHVVIFSVVVTVTGDVNLVFSSLGDTVEVRE